MQLFDYAIIVNIFNVISMLLPIYHNVGENARAMQERDRKRELIKVNKI